MSEPTTKGSQVALSREVSNFLLELSIAVHRYAMYPPDHPSLVPAADGIFQIIRRLLEKRTSLSLGIANRQLVIEGVATDRRNPVLEDLAHRLHTHQLGALIFSGEVTVEALRELFLHLATEAERGGAMPLGLRPPEEIPDLSGIRLVPVGYDALALDDRDVSGPDAAMRLWLQLAQAATATEQALSEADAPNPREVAESIRKHAREAAYDQVIVGYLLQLAQDMKDGGGPALTRVRENVSRLISELDEPTLKRLLEMGGDLQQRHRFVSHSAETLGEDAIMKVLRAAAQASGQEVSHGLVRLLTKLAFHAREGEERLRPMALSHLRGKVDELMSNWTLPDANAAAHTRILDELSRSDPFNLEGVEARPTSIPLIQMAIEVDSYGPMVEEAVDAVIEEGNLAEIVPLIEGASMTVTGRRLRAKLSDVKQIEALTQAEDVSEESLALLANLIGPEEAVPALLKVLADAPSRSVRRKVLVRLVDMGSHAARHVGPYLEDLRWYVVRNVLTLLEQIDTLPKGFSPDVFLRHPDVRVQREALPLALKYPDLRARALSVAIRSGDERMRNVALVNLREGVPETLLPALLDHIVRRGEGNQRITGIRLLGMSKSTMARRALCQMVDGGKGWFGRRKLADPNEDMLTALGALAQGWANHPEAAELLALAGRSKNTEVRRAADPGDASHG